MWTMAMIVWIDFRVENVVAYSLWSSCTA